MTRRDRQRLDDVLAAIDAIAEHLGRGDLHDGLVFDAVRARLIEVGEAVQWRLLVVRPDGREGELAIMVTP